jgi:hypothetical protein
MEVLCRIVDAGLLSRQARLTWLLDKLAERDARIAELETRLARNQWAFSLPFGRTDAERLVTVPAGAAVSVKTKRSTRPRPAMS